MSRKGWFAIALAMLAIIAGTVYLLDQAQRSARLMRADPDAIAEDADLRTFALARAKPAYDRHCASCHGGHLGGDAARGVPDLTDADWLYGEGRVAEIERTILYGIRAGNPKSWNRADMPAFARPVPYRRYELAPLEPGEIGDVVEYLLVLGGKPGDGDAARRGAALFAGKGQCFDCHAADARGDSAVGAPNLTGGSWLYGSGTRDDLYASIARGLGGVCPSWARELDAVTIRALALLVHDASVKPKPPQTRTPE